MKIIEMERRTLDGKLVEYGIGENGDDYQDWWCVIETPEEELIYDEFLEHPEKYEFLWNAMVKHAGLNEGVKWGDDDIYGYIRPNEDCPDIDETFVDGDGDEWIVLN